MNDIDDVVSVRFGRDDSRPGPFRPPGRTAWADRRTDIVPGLIYRYELVDDDNHTVTLQVYRGLGDELAGRLWDQEVRVLSRIAALNHPALPELIDGGHDDLIEPLGYVVTKGSHERLDQVDGPGYMAAHPEHAVRLLFLLTDALATLHNTGTVHRNLWPGVIDVRVPDEEGAEPQLTLSRFEMSTLTANLLQLATLDGGNSENIRETVFRQNRQALAYAPPERLDFIFPEGPARWLENEKSDVYGLGVIAWEWFYGPLPDRFDDVALGDGPAVRARARELRRKLIERLATDTAMPLALRDLIRDMIAEHPASRPSAGGVAATLNERFDAIMALVGSPTQSQTYLVTFKADEFVHARTWDWIDAAPDTEDGRLELASVIQNDLAGAELVHSPEGAKYVREAASGDGPQCTFLLLGRRAAWFGRLHRSRTLGGLGPPMPNVLVVKYPVPYEAANGRTIRDDFRKAPYRRRIPAVDVLDVHTDRTHLDDLRQDRPSWQDLHDAVKGPASVNPDELLTGQAFDWFLEYQGAMLRAREYPYRLLNESRSTVLALQYDAQRDEDRQAGSAIDSMIGSTPGLRPEFVDFFADLPDSDGGYLEVVEDHNGRPGRGSWGEVTFDRSNGEDVISVRRRLRHGPFPATGWIRPAADRGNVVALRRQTDARFEALNNRLLIRQIWNPRAIDRPAGPFAGVGAALGHNAVERMLTTEPLFALQGPPGTGKTEVIAHAVCAYLVQNTTARVLVSAQSNHALDNLALRILQRMETFEANPQLRAGFAFLRVAARGAEDDDRINRQMRPHLLANLARERRRQLMEHARTWLKAEKNRGSPHTDFMTDWLGVLDRAEAELADRLRRGASVVFATCTSATRRAVADFGSAGAFQWVIIEEAAKAWPTELAIPLARASRWTLVGDQQQLPAHRRDEVNRFLAQLAADPNEELRAHGERYVGYTKVFDLFGSLFKFEDEPITEPTRADGSGRPVPRSRRPLMRLTRQFRMRDPIAQVVSRVFYPYAKDPADHKGRDLDFLPPGRLETGRADADHGLNAPRWLDGQALVWLDTTGVERCADEPAWFNKGEAQLVADLIAGLRPFPTGAGRAGDDQFVVLTPYRRQADLLRTFDPIRDNVSTIHAYQGREADIVVTSLVRDRRRGGPDQPWRNIGHLTQPELVNVMLSRARDLLVIVGSLRHFENSGSPDWVRVCHAVRRFGLVREVARDGLK